MVYGIPSRKGSENKGEAFWLAKHKKFGYTPRGVRDEVIVDDDDGNTNYFLWGNKIATHNKKRNTLYVYDAGWQTQTTKDRLNTILAERNLGAISQVKGKWFVERDGKRFEWRGKEVFDLANPEKLLKPFSEKKAEAEHKEKEKERKAFIEKVMKDVDAGTYDYQFIRNALAKRGYAEPDIFLYDLKDEGNKSRIKDTLKWYWRQPQDVKNEIGVYGEEE